jgi:tetratricopeptide (TPR) repeat protein
MIRRPILSAAAALALLISHAAAQSADPRAIFADGVTAQQRGDYGLAIQQFRRVVKLEPKQLPAWINLGVALVQEGQFGEAIEAYQSALAIDPHNRQVQLYLGLAHFKRGDGASAAKQFEELLRTDPKNLRIATLLGASYLQSSESGRALALLAPLASTAGDDPDFLWAFGSALISTGRLREGVDVVERFAKHANSAEAWMLAGQTLYRLNEFIRAKDDLETAAALNPNMPGVQTALGQARERNADYPGAIQAFGKASAQNPRDFDAWLGLGGDQYFQRDLDNARISLKQALTLDPDSAPARYALALVEKALSQPEAAAADLEVAVKTRPDWLEAHVQLAALYFQLHRTADGARERALVDKLTDESQKAGPAPVR